MEQLVQNLKDGNMRLLEVPFPALSSGQVLIRNHYSLISAGTEGKTVKDARLGYIGKARARKEEVKKVLDSVKTLGLMKTYSMVMNKLDAPSSLGYSCAGEVIAVAADVKDFRVGDHVACGGAGAVHAEVVAVPINLCALAAPSIPLKYAAFTTVGAIALQGVRQADLRIGENCVVIGLGLVGQLTLQLLRAAGVKAIGVDIDEGQVQLAKSCGFQAHNRSNEQLEAVVLQETQGHGTDCVIITAATSSEDPINLAGTLCRRKGKVIMVGAVSPNFSRKNYYQKELDLRMSSSYGPGRYDASYEEEGIDYPYAYVRWTEQRNMQSFLDLLDQGRIDIQPLLTHTFDFKEATKAYQLIIDRNESFAGIVLKYDTVKTIASRVQLTSKSEPAIVNVGMIGAGSFGQNFILPTLKGKVNLKGIATARPNNARNVGDKFGFEYCAAGAEEIIKDKNINTIFIATRHDTHARFVMEGLKEGKNVFVEKPLCLYPSELNEIKEDFNRTNGLKLFCGFNRRFAPLTLKLKAHLNTEVPLAINYRINAGVVPADHWIHDPNVGGGRIIGEVCHFIDLCAFLSESLIEKVTAFAMKDAHGNNDSVVISVIMQNGSIASINYFSNGNKSEAKEMLEVYNGGVIAKISDFSQLTISGKKKIEMKSEQDKGHQAGITAFIDSINKGNANPIPEKSLFNSMQATFAVIESIALNGESVNVNN